MKRIVTVIAVAVVLASCAEVHPSLIPYAAHPPNLERSQTAVVISMDRQRDPPFLATIRKLDGREVECHWNYGCPIWARLAPGDHEATVRYQTDLVLNVTPTQAGSKLKFAELSVRLPALMPAHVYVIRYQYDQSRGAVSSRVEDMGERPTSGIMWPIGVRSATEHFAEF